MINRAIIRQICWLIQLKIKYFVINSKVRKNGNSELLKLLDIYFNFCLQLTIFLSQNIKEGASDLRDYTDNKKAYNTKRKMQNTNL